VGLDVLLLAAGYGMRLKPLTNSWPKCLMPISTFPLLDYWLQSIKNLHLNKVVVNTHYLHEIVSEYLDRPCYKNWVLESRETEILGTAGAIRKASKLLSEDSPLMLVHADNLCICDLQGFMDYHINKRPKNCAITMMTFITDVPDQCGILNIDSNGIVEEMYEKQKQFYGYIANAAVYIIEPEVIAFLKENSHIKDFSNEVLPNFFGRIATWHNSGVHRDIGTHEQLLMAQSDEKPALGVLMSDEWQKKFLLHPIQKNIYCF